MNESIADRRLVYCEHDMQFLTVRCPRDVGLFLLDWPTYNGIVKSKGEPPYTIEEAIEVMKVCLELVSHDGSMIFFHGVGSHGHHPLFALVAAAERMGWQYRQWITWKKRRGYGTQRNYLFTREEIVWFTKSDDYVYVPQHTAERRGYAGWNTKYPAKSEYKRVSNVWVDLVDDPNPPATDVWEDIPELMRPKHRYEKPVEIYERLIATHTLPGARVADPYVGSGASGVATIRLGRRFLGADIDGEWAEKADTRIRTEARKIEKEIG